MKSTLPLKVNVYRVKDNSTKIQWICHKVQELFRQEKRVLIAAPHLQAAQYLEALLWRFPEESFLPHVLTDTSTHERIAITLQEHHNVNQAQCLINFTSPPSTLYQQMEEVYDLYDETDPQKRELSEQRLHFYQTKDLNVRHFNA